MALSDPSLVWLLALLTVGLPVVALVLWHRIPGPRPIVLSGDVDSDLGDDLVEAATEAERHDLPIEVDAHHVTFMDSAGVAFLARLSIRSKHRVRLLRVPPTVRFLLEVTRIGELVDVAADDEAAPFRPLADQQ